MKKRLFSIILTIVLLCLMAIPASAYSINSYDMHHEAGLIAYLDTDTVIYEQNADVRMYPASITKLMTAIVMLENIGDLDTEVITFSKTALNEILGTGSAVFDGNGLKVGEQLKARDALAALLISSSGDVAYAIAEHVGGTIEGFVDMMNAKAAEMGLKNTLFENPVGLHKENHYSTARDIYFLAKKAFSMPEVKEMLSKYSYTVEATNHRGATTIYTSNLMINPNSNVYYKYAVCGKTGYTSKAGRCLVSLGDNGAGYQYISVVLKAETINGTRNEFVDSANMFRWAFNNFEYKAVLDSTTPVTEAPLSLSKEYDHLPICFETSLKAILPKSADSSTIKYELHLNQTEFTAPVEKGTVVGSADIYYAEEKIGTINLVAGQTIKASPLLIFVDSSKAFLTSVFMKIIYITIGVIVLAFILTVIVLNLGKKKHRRVKYQPLSRRERDEVKNNSSDSDIIS